MKLISVVIPCYNHGQYVEEAIASICEQSHGEVEIIVVNDGSTDPHTNRVLNDLQRDRCRVVTTTNQGLPAARNTGIRQSKGEYICCLDADDKYHPDFLQKASSILEQDNQQQYGIVTAWVQFFGTNDTIWKTLGHNCQGFSSYLQGVRNNLHSSSMFRKSCWESVGGFDESMTNGYEDWDFWLKIMSEGLHCYCIEEILIYYRQKEESMVTHADEKRPQILEKMYKKHRKFYADNLVPILLERDWEIRRLEQESRSAQHHTSPASLFSRTTFSELTCRLYTSLRTRLKPPPSSK